MEETLERIDEPREGGVRTTGGRERRRENLIALVHFKVFSLNSFIKCWTVFLFLNEKEYKKHLEK